MMFLEKYNDTADRDFSKVEDGYCFANLAYSRTPLAEMKDPKGVVSFAP
jgi:hypothetical protein